LRLLIKKKGVEIISLSIGLIVWQILAGFVVKDPFILPSFSAVILSLYQLRKGIPGDILISLWHFGIGLGFAIAVGISVGAIMGWYRVGDRIMNPFVEIIRPIPPLAWIPFAIIWFGLTHYSAGFLVFIGAVFPILLNTYAGFRNVPKLMIEAAMVLGCNKNFDVIKSVAFPSALTNITTGIRIAMGSGWMCLVAAEIFGRTSGLGYKLWHYYQLHQMDRVLRYMIILGIIGFFIKKLLKWRSGIVA